MQTTPTQSRTMTAEQRDAGMKRCKNCREPATDGNLCAEHAKRRRQRRAATASLPKCSRCNQRVGLIRQSEGKTTCTTCGRAEESRQEEARQRDEALQTQHDLAEIKDFLRRAAPYARAIVRAQTETEEREACRALAKLYNDDLDALLSREYG